jgi:hypothetical protein
MKASTLLPESSVVPLVGAGLTGQADVVTG